MTDGNNDLVDPKRDTENVPKAIVVNYMDPDTVTMTRFDKINLPSEILYARSLEKRCAADQKAASACVTSVSVRDLFTLFGETLVPKGEQVPVRHYLHSHFNPEACNVYWALPGYGHHVGPVAARKENNGPLEFLPCHTPDVVDADRVLPIQGMIPVTGQQNAQCIMLNIFPLDDKPIVSPKINSDNPTSNSFSSEFRQCIRH
jgi:hypothetical protein